MKQEKSDKRIRNRETEALTTLTEDLKQNIIAKVIEGKNYKDIANELQVVYSTILYWRHNVIKHELINAELEYQLRQAEEFTDKLMKLEAGKKDTSLLAIQQKETEFRRKYQLNAKNKYNDSPTIAIQVNLPSPIIDLGKLDSEQS